MNDIRGSDIKDLAKEDYMQGMKYKDIATKYNVSLNTIKSWKQRYEWNRKSMHTNKKVCTQIKNAKEYVHSPVIEEVKEIAVNNKLTDKQKLFCIYYIKYFNATKAYQKAYECDYITANTNGYKLLVNACIKTEIQRLKEYKLNRAMLSEEDIFQRYIDIAFADITDFIEFGRKEIEVDEKIIEVNYLDFKESNEIDGAIVSEISNGKNGVSIKLHDKMKALQWLSDRMDLLPTHTRIKLENEQKKLDHILNKDKDSDTRENDIAEVLREALEDI